MPGLGNYIVKGLCLKLVLELADYPEIVMGLTITIFIVYIMHSNCAPVVRLIILLKLSLRTRCNFTLILIGFSGIIVCMYVYGSCLMNDII